MYVVNAGVISSSEERVASAIAEAQLDFESDQLLFHEVEFFSGVGRALGCPLSRWLSPWEAFELLVSLQIVLVELF